MASVLVVAGMLVSQAPLSPRLAKVPDPRASLVPADNARRLGPAAIPSPARPPAPKPATPNRPEQTQASVAGLRFWSVAYAVRTLRPQDLPYHRDHPISLVDEFPHDSHGGRLAVVHGRLYDNPLAQARYAVDLLASYEIKRDARYLARAVAQGQRLLSAANRVGGALYFPYGFDFALHGEARDLMHAPWYSGMAQGFALSAFVALAGATKETRWVAAANQTFASFVVPRASNRPWFTLITPEGYLWFEEYPKSPPDRTLNGHIFALYGLLDYYRWSGRSQALRLLQGGLTAVAHYAGWYRKPGWISYYCLSHHVQSDKYHLIHVYQLLQLYTITGSERFASLSDALMSDFPDPAVHGTARFAAGTVRGYRFGSNGAVIRTRTIRLNRASLASASARVRVAGRSGVWLIIGSGTLAGYAVRESPKAYLLGKALTVAYTPSRTATIKAGAWRALAPGGGLPRLLRVDHPANVQVVEHAVIGGLPYFAISGGSYGGYWLPAGSLALA